jgi:hypothetical protein
VERKFTIGRYIVAMNWANGKGWEIRSAIPGASVKAWLLLGVSYSPDGVPIHIDWVFVERIHTFIAWKFRLDVGVKA